jgi:hypothetical protein
MVQRAIGEIILYNVTILIGFDYYPNYMTFFDFSFIPFLGEN